MSQPTVTSFFHTRKRQATDDLRHKAKVLILDQEKRLSAKQLIKTEEESPSSSPKVQLNESKAASVVRNIQFDAKTASPRTLKMATRRTTRSRKLSVQEGQQDIRESFSKINETREAKVVIFEKKGPLSPRKAPTPIKNHQDDEEIPAVGSTTPKKVNLMEKLSKSELSYGEIKNRINKSARLAELKASIDRIKKCEEKLKNLEQSDEPTPPKIKKFERIELEVPVSPQKALRSPMKTPTKAVRLEPTASPQRRLLFEPKEPSPIKSPTKVPAYQRFQSIVDSPTPALPLPYAYRFLGEVFRCVDTVSAMLFNRKETITFRKLKPAVQELLRRNFTEEHLAQIHAIFPEGYGFGYEKMRNFGSASKQEKFELVLTPMVEEKHCEGRNTPDGNDVMKTAAEMSMAPGVLLERRRKFYNALLDRVKNVHEKFLLSLEQPMVIPKEKITRWHPEFDVETCPPIEHAALPQPPNVEKATSAQEVLQRAKTLFNCNTRMEKALQRLAEAKMTSRSEEQASTASEGQTSVDAAPSGREIPVVDTPPSTPKVERKEPLNPALKGIPKALLEKIRAKQAAKALEAMTRTPNEDKEAAQYARLPEMSRIIRNIFVAEKKGTLTLEFVIQKLDNSYRTKMPTAELEDHIRLMCKLLPTWASIHNVRKIDHLKIAKDVDIAKVVKRFEIMANNKVKG